MKPFELIAVSDHAAASAAAADLIAERRPRTIALSGGRTPGQAYALLAERDLDWPSVDVFMADERMLPLDHAGSNFRLISRYLSATGARLHPVDTNAGAEVAARSYADQLAQYWPLDLVLLGLGADGHTASLFPGVPIVDEQALVVATWSRAAGTRRVSMSYRAINGCADVVMLVTGEDKAEALARMLRGDDIPASGIHPAGRLSIIADRAAHPG